MTRTIQLKPHESYLKLISDSVEEESHEEILSALKDRLDKIQQASELPVHTECNLVAHHSHSDVKPYSFIGISKYTCACCDWWMTNYK